MLQKGWTNDHYYYYYYLFTNDLFSKLQSPYCPNQSVETALQTVTNDILLNIMNQRVTLLLLQEVSAAFDTVDHDTLLQRPQFSCGIQGKVLSWFTSYLSWRSKTYWLMRCSLLSFSWNVVCLRVPVLFFTLYASMFFKVVKTHLSTVHCYADYI